MTDAVLLPYQQKWIADTAQVKVCEKSRRVGLSWGEAADSSLQAAAANGTDTWYIGYNKDMAQEFIRDCAFWAKHYNLAASEVEELVAETKKTIFDMGFKPTLESIKEDFGGNYTEVNAKVPVVPGGASAAPIAEFAEAETPADQAAVDALVKSLADTQMQPLMSKMLAPVVKALHQSSDYQGALEKLVEIFPDVQLDDLQASLARALFVLDTWGRLNAAADQA